VLKSTSNIFAMSALCCAMGVNASTILVDASADATLLNQSPALTLGTAGTLQLAPDMATERAVLAFDLSAYTFSAADIASATLELMINSNDGNWAASGAAAEVSVHPLPVSWNEAEATWDCPDNQCTSSWNGGSYLSSASLPVELANQSSGTVQLDVTDDLKTMLSAGPIGWVVKKELEDQTGSVTFHSRESVNPPKLVITLVAPQDVADPTVQFTSPDSAISFDNELSQINLAYGDDQGIDTSSVAVMLNGTDITTDCVIGSSSANCSITGPGQGVHLLEATVFDLSGKSASASMNVLNLSSANSSFASVWHSGAAAPAASLGNPSDLYLDIATGDLYQKDALGWNSLTNLIGPQGPQGEQGPQGVQGIAGIKGDTGPQGAKGDQGDKGDIGATGPQGLQGIQGIQGVQGPQGIQGPKGDAVLLDLGCSTNQLIQHNGTEWQCVDEAAVNVFAGLNCAEADNVTFNQGAWVCSSNYVPPQPVVTEPVITTCASIKNQNPSLPSGMYTVDPDGAGVGIEAFLAYCDMEHQGGGWTLVAKLKDGLGDYLEIEELTNTGFGVLPNEHWVAVRDKMSEGMMFLDEHGRESRISKITLDAGSCVSISEKSTLLVSNNVRFIWHDENQDCDISGQDYSSINLPTSGYHNNGTAGASLYQMSTNKFEVWPYPDSTHSYDHQDELLYFVK